MQNLLTTCAIVIGLSCSSVWAADIPERCTNTNQLPSPQDREALQAVVYDYLQLSEQSLAMRSEAIRLYKEIEARRAAKLPLSGYDLQRLSEGGAALLENRDALLKLALSHECWVYTPLSSNPETAQLQKTGILTSLAAALILYDNYLSAISLYNDDATLRQHLNQPDKSLGLNNGELNTIAKTFADPAKRERVRKGIQWYERYGRSAQIANELEGYDYIHQSIQQSPSYQLLKRRNPLKEVATHFDIFSQATVDSLTGLKNESTNIVSALFGNTVGLVEARRGKLDQKPEITNQVLQELKAGDILLEKTPFRLTDTFIPGHWGHAAIWIGTEAELRAMGIWDHPTVQPYQSRIRIGQGVVEALRSGVELNPLASFMNIDDLAVLRNAAITDQERAKIVLYSLNQLGKPYDFNFNAETTQRIFCSKLVYLAYGEMNWPTTWFLGKATVTPDNISVLATGDGPLQPVLIFLDGKKVDGAYRETMAQVLKADKPVSLSQKSKGILGSLK